MILMYSINPTGAGVGKSGRAFQNRGMAFEKGDQRSKKWPDVLKSVGVGGGVVWKDRLFGGGNFIILDAGPNPNPSRDS